MRVVKVEAESEFLELRRSWNAVARQMPGCTAFHFHEWFRAAWAWRRFDSRLWILVAKDGDAIKAILPLVLGNGPGARRAELLTIPDTQIADVLSSPQDRQAACDAFAAALLASSDWDTLHLDYLADDSGCIGTLRPALERRGLRTEIESRGQNWFVALAGLWSDYYSSRSRSLKKTVNLAANRLAKLGAVQIERVSCATTDRAQFERAVDDAISISARSWKKATGNALDQPGPRAFIRALADGGEREFDASIWLLRIGDRPLAMECQVLQGGKVHALRSDYDADYEATSVGSYLFRHLLEQIFADGGTRYYLGPGDNPYKRRWTDDGEPLQRCFVYNRTLRGRYAWLQNHAIRPLARRIRDRFSFGRSGDQPAADDETVTRDKGTDKSLAAEDR